MRIVSFVLYSQRFTLSQNWKYLSQSWYEVIKLKCHYCIAVVSPCCGLSESTWVFSLSTENTSKVKIALKHHLTISFCVKKSEILLLDKKLLFQPCLRDKSQIIRYFLHVDINLHYCPCGFAKIAGVSIVIHCWFK